MLKGYKKPYKSGSNVIYRKAKSATASRSTYLRGVKPAYAQIASVVRGMGLKGETKVCDIPAGTGALALNFNVGNNAGKSLVLVQEGSGFWNRIGRKICMKSLTIRGYLDASGGLPFTPEYVRYLIVYDKQPNGVAATWDNVIQAYDNAGATTNNALDGLNMDNRDRFVVLRDRKIYCSGQSALGAPIYGPFGTSVGSVGNKSTSSDGGIIIDEFIKLDNLECQFNGTANPATVALINTGNLFLICQGTVGSQWSFQGGSRLRFTDC